MKRNHSDSHERKMRQAWQRIADITPGNQEAARAFIQLKYGQGAKASTLAIYSLSLRHFDATLKGKPWASVEPEDATLFLSTLRLQEMSHETIKGLAAYVKAFLRWVLDMNQLPPRLNFAFRIIGNRKLPDRPVITPAEERTIMEHCQNIREQVVFGLLIEMGYRVNELLCLDVGHFEFDDANGAWIAMPDLDEGLKTGPRRLYCAKYAQLVHAYLTTHPQRDDPNAPLLLRLDRYKKPMPGHRLGHQGVWRLIKAIRERADVRHFRPHDLRHTAATRFSEANGDTEALRERLGWGPGSRMVARYVHHSQAHQERLARRAAGISDAGLPSTAGAASEHKECPWCAEDIKASARKCKHCGEMIEAVA